MKKAILAIALFLVSIISVTAQGTVLFLPVIFKEPVMPDMTIGLVAPRLDYNEVLNPSGEIAGNFSNVGTGTAARSTTYQKYGLYSYSVTTPASGDGIQLTTASMANAPHFFVARIRFMTPISLRFRLNATTKNAVMLEKIDNDWYLYGAFFSAAEASGGTLVQILRTGKPGPGTNGFYADGVHAGPMPDANGGYSTYVDGTQEGCAWLGAPNASRSFRSADSLAGGTVVDLFKKYGFFLKRIIGAGVVTPELSIDSYAMLPGGEISNEKTPPRVFSLVGEFYGDTEEDLHAKQQALELALSSSTYPGEQQIRLRFYRSAVQKEIAASYSGGLEGDLPVYYNDYQPGDAQWTKTFKFLMPASVQLTATDPFWYEVGESAVQLDTNDTSTTFRLVAARLTSTGQWSSLGPPGAGGTYTAILAIVEDGTYVYFAGNFTNFDGIAAADRIVRYNKQTGAYTAIDAGLNGLVYDMALAPNGDLYVVGSFTNASGVAAADGIARLPAGGSAFVAVGTPTAVTAIKTVIYASNNKVYFGGDFTNFAGIANADYIAAWDITTSAYEAVGTGQDGIVNTLLYNDGLLYAGGEFTNKIEVCDTSTGIWSDVGGGLDNDVYTLALGLDGLLYIGGAFEGGLTVYIGGLSKIAVWNGTNLAPLGGGVDGIVTDLAVGPDGVLYLVGVFPTAGDIVVTSGIARWNGYAYALFDITLPPFPGDKYFNVIHPSQYVDPVVKQNYNIYLGHDEVATGTTSFAGLETVQNEGSAPAFPKIIITRSGGTEAILQSIRNERTGATLISVYSLLDGETITIDLEPKNRQELSSFFPNIAIILPNSNSSQWNLLPGANPISAFVSESGSPTITAHMIWRDTYMSYN